MKHAGVLSFVLLVLAVVCLGFSWVMAAGWFGVHPGNWNAWVGAGLTFGFASMLPAAIPA